MNLAQGKKLLKGATVFIGSALVVLFFQLVEPNVEFFSGFVDEHIRGAGWRGIALYMLLAALLACMAVPRQLLAFGAGYAFGAGWGTLWAVCGITLGCVLSFSYARYLGQKVVQEKFGHRIARLEHFLINNTFAMTFIIRSLPIGNNLVTNILAGMTRIPAWPFFAGSCLGYLPQNLIFSLLGSGINVDNGWRILASAILFVISGLIGVTLFRKYGKEVS